MKTFEYFLFENFDADAGAANPDNPRDFLCSATDGLIGAAAGRGDCAGGMARGRAIPEVS